MDYYQCGFPGHERVDLDDPKTYEGYSWDKLDVNGLWDECLRKVGYATMYVNYFHPDWDPKQKARIDQLVFWLGKEYRRHFAKDEPESRLWLKKWLFLFEDETENMC